MISDNDECSDSIVVCDQVCVNEIGSFHCECESGFSLSNNGITCKGN